MGSKDVVVGMFWYVAWMYRLTSSAPQWGRTVEARLDLRKLCVGNRRGVFVWVGDLPVVRDLQTAVAAHTCWLLIMEFMLGTPHLLGMTCFSQSKSSAFTIHQSITSRRPESFDPSQSALHRDR